MRWLLLTTLLLVGCGKVESFTDAGGGDDTAVDAKVESDGMPFVCEDQACGAADDCCPSACNANNDADCGPTCDNGVLEAGEECDPLSSCPGSCPAVGCQLRVLEGSGCQARCVNGGQQTACQDGDGCCPGGCNETNDLECAAVCDNGVVESGEECDPLSSCPTSCPQIGCTLYDLFNAGTCGAACVATGQQGACQSGDGCCPSGCNANNDGDCAPSCGNSVVEEGEVCDGNCPTCSTEPFSCFGSTGSAGTCDLRCHVPVQTCGGGDGCCPYVDGTGGNECTRNDDAECAGLGWQFREWYQPIAWGVDQCAVIRVYGMVAGDSVAFTTCSPDGGGAEGDSMITKITNGDGLYDYFPALNPVNDDTSDPFSISLMHGWNCQNGSGQQYLSTAPHNPGGVILVGDAFRVDVTVCGFGNTSGRSRFFIWWNGTSNPNPG